MTQLFSCFAQFGGRDLRTDADMPHVTPAQAGAQFEVLGAMKHPQLGPGLRRGDEDVPRLALSPILLTCTGTKALLRWLTAVVLLFLATAFVLAHAASLTVRDGVVIKFGTDAQLVVRDRFVPGQALIFTSLQDDSIAGQTGATPQSAVPGSWRGVRIEKSAFSHGALILGEPWLRFADTGFTLRGSALLQYPQFTDNTFGLRVLEDASPVLIGASFLRNGTGIEAQDNSTPTVSGGQFSGNTLFAIDNKTPATVIEASNNWWGHSSGPKEASSNPNGLGDAISAGVNFAAALSEAPLLNPSVRLAEPRPYFEQHNVLLDLACVNAIDYRVAENGAFSGVAFEPLANGRARVSFTTSAGDGRKSIAVQFRSVTGHTETVFLDGGGVLIDSEVPSVVLTNPSVGSLVTGPITLEASANDGSGVARVEFYLDTTLLASVSGAPYALSWDPSAIAEGAHVLKAQAIDAAGRSSAHSVEVSVSHVPSTPDTEGPALSNLRVNGGVLDNGVTLTRSGPLTLTASDRSGVNWIELRLDGQLMDTGNDSANLTLMLVLEGVANGTHTLTLRALDSLGNETTRSYSITVAHAPPEAPLFSTPAPGTLTRTPLLAVTGYATPGSTVQLLLNSVPVGGALPVNAEGRFSGSVTLVPGTQQLQATASNANGTSPASAPIAVTLDVTVPASPSSLTALTQAAGKVRLNWVRSTDPNTVGYDIYRAPNGFDNIAEALKVNPTPINSNPFEDLPPNDAVWTYRVVAVNAAGTPSLPTNAVQVRSDATAPKAISIVYAPLGKVDPLTGRIGQGRVNVTLTTNEALVALPYLSVVPEGNAPIPVTLEASNATTFSGSFLIDANTASGTANALFSARDAAGNRGTEIESGATLQIDTEGPLLSAITVNPATPIKNDAAPTISASFSFSKAPASTPTIKYLLSGVGRSSVTLSGVTRVDERTYQASFKLPTDAGLPNPEALSFSYQAQDALDNIATRVAGFNRFQVYQGDLPPLDVPFGFTAKAQPGGKVKLAWQAVDEAHSYQLYRQAPDQTELQPLLRVAGIEHVDQTPADGTYTYAVATVRQANGQESVSGQSAALQVVASATAPGAPQGLVLQLTGQGIYATWQAPLASNVDSYNLYRATGTRIDSIEGLTPLKTRIKNPVTYDSNPSPTEGAYVVTAMDAAGNESAISNSAYLNATLLPVRNVKVEQIGSAQPLLSWDAPAGTVAGYLVYVGPETNKTKLTPAPIADTHFSDSGFSSGERRYSIATVDVNGVELARSVLLPAMTSQIVSGLPIQRGVMNKLQVQVTNTSSTTFDGVRAVVRLPINKEATAFKDHRSAAVSLAPNQTRLLSVVVGGYADLPSAAQAQVGVELANEGEVVKVAHEQAVAVGDSALIVGLATDEFTRGSTGKVKLSIENTSEVDVELLTAVSNGGAASTELRFKLLDHDGNVLATQAFKQVFGANVITLVNGLTVARIAAGTNYVSDVFEINVPSASPDQIRVRLEVDTLRYHSGEEDEVQISGRGSEKVVSLRDTAYYGEVLDVNPVTSFGDEDVVIRGRAVDRSNGSALAYSNLRLVLNQRGFERMVSVITDSAGQFIYTFKPTTGDAGVFKVSAVHPSVTDRPEQKAFTIQRVTVGPTPYQLDVPKNYPFVIPFTANAGAGTSATNLRLTLNAASQPTGQLPEGVSAQLPAPVSLTSGQTLNLPVTFSATNDAQNSGSLIFDVNSDEQPLAALAQLKVNYQLSAAQPFLTATPNFLETGMAQGGSQVETLVVQNKGTQDAFNLQFTLSKPDGTPAPAWVSLASKADGTLAVGASRSIDIAFTPPTDVAEGMYEFKLNVVGENVAQQAMGVFVNLTQSGQGHVFFKASDIYTATPDKDGRLIEGLANATITVQNEDVPTVAQEQITDAVGEALFQNLPAGRYKFRARATNHQEIGGRLIVKPGITVNQPVFLQYNLITVEWSVREITIQDRYEITLNATFETDVPAAVVVLQPASINLPTMRVGETYNGELTLTNYGLIRADNVQRVLPISDAHYKFTFGREMPTQLQAKERVVIPYQVLKLADVEDSSGDSSGGGCSVYSNSLSVTCMFVCANGQPSVCGSSASWVSANFSSCPTGGSGGSGGGGGGGGGGLVGGGLMSMPGNGRSGPSVSIPTPGQKCVYVPKGGTQCN